MIPNKSSREKYYEELSVNPSYKDIVNVLSFDNRTADRPFDPTELKEIEILNSSIHVVKKCRYGPSNFEFAVKYTPIRQDRFETNNEANKKKLENLLKELKGFKNLINHENIVKFYGLCIDKEHVLVCMELMDFSLRDYYITLHDAKKPFPEDLVGYVVKSMIQALLKCQEHGLNHRMVKPSNIFFNRVKGEIKLGDYGEARILHDSMSSTFSGTLCYWAPERFSLEYKHDDSTYNIGCNIWSLGITLIEIILGEFPYKDHKGRITENIVLLQKQIGELQTKNLEHHLGQMSIADSIKGFIRKCLVTSIEKRTYDMITGTEFYKSIKEPYTEVVKKYAEQYESVKKALENRQEQDLLKSKVEPKTPDTDPKKVFEQETFSFNVANVKEVKKIYTQRRSEVFEGLYELDDRRLAIKRLFFKSHENPQKKKDRFIYEIQVIKKLNNKSPFLTYIYEYEIKDNHGNLYMELMNMNLKELYLAVHKSVEKFPEQLLRCITVSTINALSYCHEKNIIHCDIKPTNVLINQHGKIKLTDFDSAIDLDNSDQYDRIGGTMAYWAPDLFVIDNEGSRLDPRRDIWSLGITLAEALLGRLPYLDNEDPVPQGYETIQYLYKIINDNTFLDVGFTFEEFQSIFYLKFAEYNEAIIQFLRVCLQFIEKLCLTKLQTTDFYQACPKNNDEIYAITRNHIQSHFQETTQLLPPSVNSTVQPAPSSSTQIAAPLSAATIDENKNANLSIHTQCEIVRISILIAFDKFSDFRKLLEDKDKFDYYSKKANEFYTGKLYDKIIVYPHFSKPKGLAIIINEIEWTPNPEKRRNGSEKDAKKLEILFHELGYEIYQQETLENLSKKQMLDHLKAFATDDRHKDGSSCIVVIMAHGNEDVVCDTEGTMILINHEIKPLFNGKNAKDLVGKPKLFIYQSCRGANHDDGVDFDNKAEIQKLKAEIQKSLASKQKIDGACLGKQKHPDPSPNNPSPQDPKKIPIYSDFFVLYATVRTTPAFRSTSGSMFISAICDTFYKFAHLFDLEHMARHIKLFVAECTFVIENEQTKETEVNYQQPQLESTNSKEFYMFPGVYIN